MPHFELSLTSRHDDVAPACGEWAPPVRTSVDACLLLDASGAIAATSASCRSLLGLPDGIDDQGRAFTDDGVVELVNFSASGGALPQYEIERIPPLAALATQALARGLLRVSAGGIARTLDAISTPLHGGVELAGSLTFFRRC